jgi:hypothetical protein
MELDMTTLGNGHTNGNGNGKSGYITGKEAARLLGNTPQGVGQMGRTGKIARMESEGRYTFTESDVRRLAGLTAKVGKGSDYQGPQPGAGNSPPVFTSGAGGDGGPDTRVPAVEASTQTIDHRAREEASNMTRVRRYISLVDAGTLNPAEALALIRSLV